MRETALPQGGGRSLAIMTVRYGQDASICEWILMEVLGQAAIEQ